VKLLVLSEVPLYSRGTLSRFTRSLFLLIFCTDNAGIFFGCQRAGENASTSLGPLGFRAPSIGGHRNLFCRKAMLPFGSHQAPLETLTVDKPVYKPGRGHPGMMLRPLLGSTALHRADVSWHTSSELNPAGTQQRSGPGTKPGTGVPRP
jgi:hypothetical protein